MNRYYVVPGFLCEGGQSVAEATGRGEWVSAPDKRSAAAQARSRTRSDQGSLAVYHNGRLVLYYAWVPEGDSGLQKLVRAVRERREGFF